MREPLTVGKDVVVIGGGDTSMDCVRTAVRLGAEHVTCVYRRTEAEMLGRGEEREHARQEGVDFQFLTIPLRFIGDDDGNVAGVECQRMALGEPDESGRRRPVPVPHSEFVIPAETVAIAIGYNADPDIKDAAPGVQTNRWNLVEVHPETYMTSAARRVRRRRQRQRRRSRRHGTGRWPPGRVGDPRVPGLAAAAQLGLGSACRQTKDLARTLPSGPIRVRCQACCPAAAPGEPASR